MLHLRRSYCSLVDQDGSWPSELEPSSDAQVADIDFEKASSVFLYFFFKHHQLFNLVQKPFINFSKVLNGFKRNAQLKSIINMKQAVPARMF